MSNRKNNRDSGLFLAILIVGFTLGFQPESFAFEGSNISVKPTRYRFAEIAAGSSSNPRTFTITNDSTIDTLDIGSLSLAGTNASEFSLLSDNCSSQTLSTSGFCTVQVVFSPASTGFKFANLLIPSSDPDTPILNAFFSNYESSREESSRRIPPTLYSAGIPEEMAAGSQYTLTWSVLGYHDNYKTQVAFFDCTGEMDCGASHTDASLFETSEKLSPLTMEIGPWEYRGVSSTLFNYSYSFTPPSRKDPSSDIVIRFYIVSKNDDIAGKNPLSLLIPGNMALNYYDTSGRRILSSVNSEGITIDPSTDLMWQDDGYTDVQDWYAALDYCENLELFGYSDWALPYKSELSVLYEKRDSLRSDLWYYWSPTDVFFQGVGTWVDLRYPHSIDTEVKERENYVRCVRGEQRD
ncbi:MAG: choice-of-anchor D domain-containing protein [Proteobacteria bacterium]|nr:choice-of-anchor D domain-containing protein [Pseudomonadota bacterium]